MSTPHIMFVYGTLKKGQPNNYVMNQLSAQKASKYLGIGKTVETYPLVVSPQHFNLPLLLKEDSKGKRVQGEVYEVNAAGRDRLDDFEDHPNMYERLEIPIEMDQDGPDSKKVVTCWTYFFKDYDESDVQLEHLESYDSYAVRGQEYDTSENPDHPDNR